MKAIVHIGAPKTGSSTIQEFLFRNTDALASQGFRFKRNFDDRGSQYEFVIAALARLDKLLPGVDRQTRYSSTDLATHKRIGAEFERQFAADVAGWTEPVALFSSEYMHPWLRSVEDIREHDRIFSEHFESVRYILYIRNQEDLILSGYSERLKRGANTRLDDYLTARVKSADHEPRVRFWLDAVGRDRFDLRLLDPTFLKDGDLLADFASACGFSLEGLTIPPRINESVSAAAAEFLRATNERVPEMRHDGQHNPLRKGVVARVLRMSPDDAPRLALTPGQRESIRTHVEAGNESLRRQFFPDRPTLFQPARSRAALPREEVLEQALDIAVRLFIKMRRGNMAALTDAEQTLVIQRAPGGKSTGVQPPPKKQESARKALGDNNAGTPSLVRPSE